MSDNHDLLNDNEMCSFSGHEAEDMCFNCGDHTCGDGSIDVKGEIVTTEECLKIKVFLMIAIFADHKRDQRYCLLGNISVRKMFLLERSFEDMLCIKRRVVATG